MSRGGKKSADDFRARFEENRARLVERHRQGEGGGVVVRAYRRLVDAAIRKICTDMLEGAQELAVIATGGYGRGELAFASDIDIQVLYRRNESKSEVVPFIQRLWDLGWEIGHQVVNLEEAIELASSDRETLTSYLELRTIWGDDSFAQELDREVRFTLLQPKLDEYLAGKVAELERRHAEAGDTVYLSEPDVKHSPGGLRDLHTLLWLSNAAGASRSWRAYLTQLNLNSEQYQRIQVAYDLTWRVRNALHLLKGRPWDRLDHRSQSAIAEELGYCGDSSRLAVEQFMHDYYRCSRNIYTFTRLQLAAGGWMLKIESPTMLAVLKQEGEEVESWNQHELVSNPLAVLERFKSLARNRSSVSAETAAYLNEHGHRLGVAARKNQNHGRLMLELLEGRNAAWGLKAMHQLDVLGGVIPEFERLTALVQFDPYHHYTADEHTMRMLDALEALLDGGERSVELGVVRQISEVLEHLSVEKWYPARSDIAVIRLAILLHDVGKSTGGSGHAERGARVARNVGNRLKMDPDSLSDAIFLVRHHLLLNSVAQRRDITEELLLKRLQRLIRTPERLHMLTLLTVADLAALNPVALTPWKCRLLTDLVNRLESLMAGERPWLADDIVDMDLDELGDKARRDVISFLKSMPSEYGRDLELEGLEADAILFEAFMREEKKPGAAVAAFEHNRENSRFTLVTEDRERLLSLVCGLLAANDITIFQARIFTRLDNVVFDRFTVADADGGGHVRQDQVVNVMKDLSGALAGSVDVESMLKAHRQRWSLRDRPRMEYPVSVINDPSASSRYTVIEIRAHDHVGLLHDISAAMAEVGVSIHQAFVSTEGERAVDAFYVSDPLGAPLDAEACNLLVERLERLLTDGRL